MLFSSYIFIFAFLPITLLGYYFFNHFAATDTAAIVQNFVTNYTAEYGEAPNALAALAYDSVYAMAQAIENAGTLDSADIITALANVSLTDTVTGLVEFDANGDAIKLIPVIQIVNGEQVVVAKVGKLITQE